MITFIIAMMSSHLQPNFDELLRAHGVQATPQREAVWRYFVEQHHGRSIANVVDALRAQGIGQATVYRTVLLFVELGLLRRQQDQAGKTFYIIAHPTHTHHLICRSCHSVVDFHDCHLGMLEKLLGVETGYVIEDHYLEVYGICPACNGGHAGQL